ncbi:MAG: hypothetical protein NZ853_01040 [Leptospiraceae bacterium]|nr:hypothetical protein [Leptospiraceae bacterium]MDW7976186.1 hypothetical protein [Leptospiraceae bacterium]
MKKKLEFKDPVWNSLFFHLDSKEKFKIEKAYSFDIIDRSKENLSLTDWNDCGIYFFYNREYYFSEFCFLMALEQSQSYEPMPFELNDEIKLFLNLLFFYEQTHNKNEKFQDKRNLTIKRFLNLIKNREDLIITSLKEVRKRNLPKLEVELAKEFYQTQQNVSDNFIAEYITSLITTRTFQSEDEALINKVQNRLLKDYLIEEIGRYYFFSKNYKSFVEFFESNRQILEKKKKNPSSIFYFERLFISYFELYKNGSKKEIPDEWYQEVRKASKLSKETYLKFLEYFHKKEFLFQNYASLREVLNKDYDYVCGVKIFSFLCKSIYTLEKQKAIKEVFGSYDANEIQQYKELIFHY